MDLPLSVTNDHSIPLPPPGLRFKVAGTEDADWFVKSGRQSVQDLTRALASIGRTFDDFNHLLEWGCGCGRILRHLSVPRSPRRICGNDIDQEALSWITENLSWVETSLTNGMPPLPYADGSFDLVFNHSVMTHLDVTYQDAWLVELKRVLRPAGIAILTVHGRHAFQQFLDTLAPDSVARIRYMEDLSTAGILYIKQDGWSDYFPDFYHTTFHDIEYIFTHWSKFLNPRSYIPRGSLDYQDMIVLQNPTDGAPASRTYHDYQGEAKNDLLSARQELAANKEALAKMKNDLLSARQEVADVTESRRRTRDSFGRLYDKMVKLAATSRRAGPVQIPKVIVRELARQKLTHEYEAIASSPLLDATWYLATYRDVAARGMDPAYHYLMHGAAEGRNPGPYFDTNSYLNLNQDVAAARLNPLLHFVQFTAEDRGVLTAEFRDQTLFADG